MLVALPPNESLASIEKFETGLNQQYN